MKALRPRISSFLLAILVLCSTFSFAIEKHYCHGRVVDYSFFGLMEDCCGSDLGEATVSMSCCANVKELVQASNDELQIPLLEDGSITFNTVSNSWVYPLIIDVDVDSSSFSTYLPPEVPKDVQVLYQSFLI